MLSERRENLAGKYTPFIGIAMMTPMVYLTALDEASGNPVAWWRMLISGWCVILVLGSAIYRIYIWYLKRRMRRRYIGAYPENVRVESLDGGVTRCGCLRDPDFDKGDTKAFLVVPLNGYRLRRGDEICWDKMPLDVILLAPAPYGRILRYDRSRHN